MNTYLDRRTILRGAALTPLAAALAACAGQTVQTAVPKFVAAEQAIGNAFLLAMPGMVANGMPAAIAAEAKQIIDDIAAAGNALTAAASASQGASTLVTIETEVNALVPAITPFVAGVPYIGIAIAAIPAIEVLVDFGASLLTQQTTALAAKTPATPSSETTAVRPTAMAPNAALNELLRIASR